MATLKKNAVNQILFTMVDKTNFASIESGITSDFTTTYFGVAHGGSAAAATGSVSKAISVVTSGIFRATLKATECNYDWLMVRVKHASCADQMMTFEMATANDADVSGILSDIQSYLVGISGELSNVASLVAGSNIASAVWAASIDGASMASNIASQVWAHATSSDVQSKIGKIISIASDTRSFVRSGISNLISDKISDLQSVVLSAMRSRFALAPTSDQTSNFQSVLLSAMRSRFTLAPTSDQVSNLQSVVMSALRSQVSDVISDMHSLITTTGANLNTSVMSDLRSAVAAGPAATVTASDVSLIAAAVWDTGYSDLTTASSFGSYLLATVSNLNSFVLSQVANISDILSDVGSTVSDIRSMVKSTATAGDVGSAVWSVDLTTGGFATAGAIGSLLRGTISNVSAMKSNLSDLRSFVRSGIASTLSDVHSLISSRVTGTLAVSDDVSNLQSVVLSALRSRFALAPTSDQVSDMQSVILSAMRSRFALAPTSDQASTYQSALLSALRSQVAAVSNTVSDSISDLQSTVLSAMRSRFALAPTSDQVSNFQSALLSGMRSRFALAPTSDQVSNFQSVLLSGMRSRFTLVSSAISDVDSEVSDLRSYVRGTLTPSNLTSYMWTTEASGSDIQSKVGYLATKFASRIGGVLTTHASMASYFSDLKSTVSKVGSDMRSLIATVSAELSNVYSMVTGLSGPLSDVYSSVSDLRSFVRGAISDDISDLKSDVLSAMRSRFLINASSLSDIQSYLVGISALLSDTHSAAAAAAAAADITSIASGVWAHSRASNLFSMVGGISNQISDFQSVILSALRSQVAGVSASVDTASLASAVWAHSRASNMFSMVGGISNQISDFRSAALSCVRSTTAAATITASNMSDIASRVWAESRASNLFSKVGGISNQISDFQSVALSAMRSRFATVSDDVSDFKSDILSALRSQVAAVSGELSNVYSMVAGISGTLSDFRSMAESLLDGISDQVSDVQSALDVQDAAFTDATTLTANTLKDRVRTLGWILRNKMKVNDTTGAVTLYKDDGTTTAYTVAAGLLDDGTSTLRKRIE